jgi:hypothetical protein
MQEKFRVAVSVLAFLGFAACGGKSQAEENAEKFKEHPVGMTAIMLRATLDHDSLKDLCDVFNSDRDAFFILWNAVMNKPPLSEVNNKDVTIAVNGVCQSQK